jgi:hypothetical protein
MKAWKGNRHRKLMRLPVEAKAEPHAVYVLPPTTFPCFFPNAIEDIYDKINTSLPIYSKKEIIHHYA